MKRFAFSLASLLVLLMIGLCVPVEAQQAQTVNIGAATIAKNSFLVIGRGVLEDGSTAETIAAGNGIMMDAAPGTALSATVKVHYQVEAGLQDLEAFFMAGGTVQLVLTGLDTDGQAEVTGPPLVPNKRAPMMYDLVISEIMWGRDVNGVANDTAKQWIEIYNTTDADITIVTDVSAATDGGVQVQLVFTPFTSVGSATAKAHATDGSMNVVVSDTISNVGFGGKWTMPGSSGAFTAPPNTLHAAAQSNLVSAYRNINYDAVTGTHSDAIRLNNTVNETVKRTKQIEQFNAGKGADGTLSGSWKATPVAGSRYMARWLIGSPGMIHIPDKEFTFVISTTSIPSNSVVINEIRSDTSSANVDWVELYNAGTEAVGLWDWELTAITGTDPSATDTYLVGWDKPESAADRLKTSFPKNEDFKLQPGEYLLIVNRDPRETQLANGVDVDAVIAGKQVQAGASHQYIVRDKLQLPSANFTLILRNGIDKNVRHEDPRKEEHADARASDNVAPSEKIMDFAGNYGISVDTSEYNTKFFPFRGWDRLAGTTGKDGENIKIGATHSFSRKRYQANDGHHKDAWEPVTHKGGIGYDRGTDLTVSPGTPGYPNTALLSQLIDDKNNADATDDVIYSGEISISEVMYDAGPRWNLIQWIELYNSSMTEAMNLKDWELEIRNATDDVESYVDSSFEFNDAYILPNQTLLLVSGTGTNDVADNRVYNLYQHHRRELGLTNRRSVLLSPSGFYLKLTDKNDDVVDEAGNVMIDGAERNIVWEFDARNPDYRQSLVRQYGSRELYDGTADMADDGLMMESWMQSDLGSGAGIAFYGHRDDAGTPGYRLGGPLPVSLSKFRPVRNQETGHVDIQWITQSELNNAGFNLLRAESKTGDFKVINVKGIIAGHGTTSEKHVYTFTDTTAKPNIVYYYQIEDVSFNGQRTTLTTTHLRGHVGAGGKLTTTWGDLKQVK